MNARDIGEYLGELVPTSGKPAKACRQCGDRVFYRLRGRGLAMPQLPAA